MRKALSIRLIKMLDRLQAELEATQDLYAPKLTENEALNIRAEIEDCTRVDIRRSDAAECAIEALCAAGVRFKEEA
jgi:hypothetical protein